MVISKSGIDFATALFMKTDEAREGGYTFR